MQSICSGNLLVLPSTFQLFTTTAVQFQHFTRALACAAGPFPHSLTNESCSVNDCRGGQCTWHNQSDGTPMIDTIRFPDLKGLVDYGHSLGSC
jgi:hypothetical protein